LQACFAAGIAGVPDAAGDIDVGSVGGFMSLAPQPVAVARTPEAAAASREYAIFIGVLLLRAVASWRPRLRGEPYARGGPPVTARGTDFQLKLSASLPFVSP
jgi:hypothetical protein